MIMATIMTIIMIQTITMTIIIDQYHVSNVWAEIF